MTVLLDPRISWDQWHDGKKCGSLIYDSNRLFYLKGVDATPENCKANCLEDQKCVGLSGAWNGSDGWGDDWCLGCKVPLDAKSKGAIAFKKSGKVHLA